MPKAICVHFKRVITVLPERVELIVEAKKMQGLLDHVADVVFLAVAID
jgi:hypothetical protein